VAGIDPDRAEVDPDGKISVLLAAGEAFRAEPQGVVREGGGGEKPLVPGAAPDGKLDLAEEGVEGETIMGFGQRACRRRSRPADEEGGEDADRPFPVRGSEAPDRPAGEPSPAGEGGIVQQADPEGGEDEERSPDAMVEIIRTPPEFIEGADGPDYLIPAPAPEEALRGAVSDRGVIADDRLDRNIHNKK
jgi:hypothetical protein